MQFRRTRHMDFKYYQLSNKSVLNILDHTHDDLIQFHQALNLQYQSILCFHEPQIIFVL